MRIFNALLRETRGSIIKDNSRPIKWDTLCTRHRWHIFVFHIWWSTNKIFNSGLKNLLMLPDKWLEILIENVFVLVSASKYIPARRDSKYCDCWSLTWKKNCYRNWPSARSSSYWNYSFQVMQVWAYQKRDLFCKTFLSFLCWIF